MFPLFGEKRETELGVENWVLAENFIFDQNFYF